MGWFFGPQAPKQHVSKTDRLRQVEDEEAKALGRVISAGARATINATEGSESAARVRARVEERRCKTEHIMNTAEGVFDLLGRKRQ